MKLRRASPGAGAFGTTIVVSALVAAMAAPWVAPYSVSDLSGEPLEAPSARHWLGTNNVGQDLWSQLLLGTRTSLSIAAMAGVGAVAIGAALGLSAAWFGRTVDVVVTKSIDLALVAPRLPLLLLVGVYLGPSSTSTALAIAATSWAGAARVLRARSLGLRVRGHVRFAVGVGASWRYVLRRHLAPELVPLLGASFVTIAGRAIALEAGLAFLGVGDVTRASWGTTLREALGFRSLFRVDAWQWWLVPPVVAVSLVTLGVTLVGISLERWVNPRVHTGARP